MLSPVLAARSPSDLRSASQLGPAAPASTAQVRETPRFVSLRVSTTPRTDVQDGCTAFVSYLNSVCALLSMLWVPWHWEIEGATQFLRREVGPYREPNPHPNPPTLLAFTQPDPN